MNDFIQYLTASAVIVFPTLGIGIGQGLISRYALRLIEKQPGAENDISKTTIISMTLSETAVVLPVIFSLLLILDKPTAPYAWLGYIGILLALALPACLVGVFSSLTGRVALDSIARQPLVAANISQLLLITQSILQTPTIFGFIIALLIRGQINSAVTLMSGLKLLASGLAFSIGIIGPVIGLLMFARNILKTTGINRTVYPALRTFTFVGQALIEAPIILVLLTSIAIVALKINPVGSTHVVSLGLRAIMAALCSGLSTLGTGLSSGRVASTAARCMGEQPELALQLTRTSVITQTFIDTSAIYGTLLGLIILFF